MDFNVNAPILFVLVGIIVAFVLAQSAFFLWRAVNRAREIGLPQETIRKTISAAAVFTVAPAVAILVGVISLSKSLGIALPWLRLSVVGSLTYETVAAGTSLTELGLDTNTPHPYGVGLCHGGRRYDGGHHGRPGLGAAADQAYPGWYDETGRKGSPLGRYF